MKQTITNIILIICLIVIAVLLTILVMQRTKSIDTPQTTQKQSTHLDITPYYYDYGYWYNPLYWWYGNDYHRHRRHNNNYNYNYNYQTPTPTPTLTPTSTPTLTPTSTPTLTPTQILTPIPTLGMGDTESNIIDVIPTPQLIAPIANSVFPLPTLVSPHLPEEIPINPADLGAPTQSPIPSMQSIPSTE
jgi:hypothetical protein